MLLYQYEEPAAGPREPDAGVPQSSSRGAPTMSRGCRKLFPVNRRIVALSTRRSTVATAVASEGKRLLHLLKPVFNAEPIVMRRGES